ncbi:MAG: hypothetical protein ABJB86_08955 [Bacteroidota bacterium]
MTNLYQFNCSGNSSVVAFSNDKTGANIPASDACNGEWVLYVENIINESITGIKDSIAGIKEGNADINNGKLEIFEDVAAKGWHITSRDKIMTTP